MVKVSATNLSLFLIILISILFRFYNFNNLQYWSGDEEIASAQVRRVIVEKKIALLSPNSNLGFSLGSYFHLLSAPIFLISKINPIYVQLVMSALGVVTTLAIFYAGFILAGKRLALTASLLYGSSLLASLFDRRWWPLSLNTFLVTIALIGLYKVILEKKYYYSILIAVAAGFAFHADPSLATVALATIASIIFFKINILNRQFLVAILVLFLFVAPLFVFELRHPGTIISPIIASFSKSTKQEGSTKLTSNIAKTSVSTFARLFAPNSSTFAEENFCYCEKYTDPLFSPFTQIAILFLIIFPIYLIAKKKPKQEKAKITILYIFLACFFAGTVIFNLLYRLPIHQHYFTVIFPVIFILVSYSLVNLFKGKLLYIVLLLFLLVNLRALVFSKFAYPLSQKLALVRDLSGHLASDDFSLYINGDDYFHGGGFTGLFILNNKHPKKSYIYPFYDWMYQAHSLYTVKPQTEDLAKLVIIGPKNSTLNSDLKILYQKEIGNLKGSIIDNSDFTFSENLLNN